MFRELKPSEIKTFRRWARKNYKPLTPINGVWHPIVQEECSKMNRELKIEDVFSKEDLTWIE